MELLPQLKESVLRARLQKLAARVVMLRSKQERGILGPRVIRARLRLINQERKKLAADARELGYDVD